MWRQKIGSGCGEKAGVERRREEIRQGIVTIRQKNFFIDRLNYNFMWGEQRKLEEWECGEETIRKFLQTYTFSARKCFNKI